MKMINWQAEIIAHRGASALAPENTLASFKKAWQLGLRWLEFDVMLTQDEVPIVIHDSTLNRTSNGDGKVSETRWQDCQRLDAGSWFSSRFKGEKIPELAECLAFATQHGMHINIELKPLVGQETKLATVVWQRLSPWLQTTNTQVLLSSFSFKALQAMREQDGNVALSYLLDHWTEDWPKALAMLNGYALHANAKRLTKAIVAQVTTLGYPLAAYTVNDFQQAQQLIDWGVAAIFSDIPQAMQQAFCQQGK